MSRLWVALAVACSGVASVLVLIGYMVPDFLPFTKNLIAEGVGLLIALALAIILIEGRSLTQQSRRRKIVAQMAKSTLQEASEIGMMLNWELAKWMVSLFDGKVDIYGGDKYEIWDVDIKPLLKEVYAEAIDLDHLPHVDTLPYEDYKKWIEEGKSYSRRIRNSFQANLDLHEYLLELVEVLDEFDSTLTRCMWHTSVSSEIERFHGLGQLGNGFIHVMETVGLLYLRLPEQALTKRERIRRREDIDDHHHRSRR